MVAPTTPLPVAALTEAPVVAATEAPNVAPTGAPVVAPTGRGCFVPAEERQRLQKQIGTPTTVTRDDHDANSLAPEREEEGENGADKQGTDSPEDTKTTEFNIDVPTLRGNGVENHAAATASPTTSTGKSRAARTEGAAASSSKQQHPGKREKRKAHRRLDGKGQVSMARRKAPWIEGAAPQ